MHWTGKQSLYFAHVVSLAVAGLDSIKDAAAASMTRKRRQGPNNVSRRAVRRSEMGSEVVTAERHLRSVVDEIQSVIDFLVENIAGFENQPIVDKYAAYFEKFPLAKTEILKVAQELPQDVSSAGKHLAAVMALKGTLELRLARRANNLSHSYDGNKWLRRKLPSSAASQSSKRTTGSGSSGPHASSVSTPPSGTSGNPRESQS